MQLPRRARELVLVAVLLALPLLFLRANIKAPSQLNGLDRAILRISAPVEALFTGCGRGIAHAWHRYVALWRVSDDNARLVDENARLRTENERLTREAARAGELESLLKLRQDLHAETVAAHVIGAETSSLFRVVRVRLDAGELAVKPGMPVLTSAGVVGRIERVFGPYSDVLLLTDPKSAIDIVLPRTGSRGVLKGIAGSSKYAARIDYLLRKDEAAAGDLVVTSGLGGFPRDLPVGKIVKIKKRSYGLYQDAEVEPAVDLGRLSDVLVVVAAGTSPKAER